MSGFNGEDGASVYAVPASQCLPIQSCNAGFQIINFLKQVGHIAAHAGDIRLVSVDAAFKFPELAFDIGQFLLMLAMSIDPARPGPSDMYADALKRPLFFILQVRSALRVL